MSRVLQEEIDGMSEEELLESMGRIKKSELSYEGIVKDNTQWQSIIYSIEMLNEKYTSIYEERYTRKPELLKEYNNIKDILIKRNLKYIYTN